MAASIIAPPQDNTTQIVGNDSDYGSDLDEAAVDSLFSQSESPGSVIASIEAPTILDDHGGDSKPVLRFSRLHDNLVAVIAGLGSTQEALQRWKDGERGGPAVEVEYDEVNRHTFSPPPDEEEQRRREREQSAPSFVRDVDKNDTRTPLQRFRTAPKKPLSVTDIISPAWCELQYFYNLSRYGRVRRTTAMKQGSSVHKVLEEEVHTDVPVDVVTKEDRFALRIWNVISGLRTLRQTGRTRELEVWGLLDGEVVNGVVDFVTTTCPDEEAEVELSRQKGESASERTGAQGGKKQQPLPSDQRTLTDYLTTTSPHASILEQYHNGNSTGNGNPWLGTLQEKSPTIYLLDVKTRQSRTLPPEGGSQLRPTHYQLMLYHRLFTALAGNQVPADRIFERYAVDPEKTFSDAFLAQMSQLSVGLQENHPTVFGNADEADPGDGWQDSTDTLLAHNNLSALWSLMIADFARTVSRTSASSTTSPSHSASISPLLTAEFRTSSSGTLLGRRSFLYNASQLDAYVSDELRWWRGERETKGVEVEEAYKCRLCEFAEGCTWRATKVEEGVRRARLRKKKRRTSAV
ncbi:hypothetical protein BAUCODRAFT_34426 [Baudoinia panamericana UAMH 10762]|uniref:Exonuclease V n=1 Tax=Baudoinia panamericana (strain UAMH 10762) TaxID=717646 RepID=M2LMU6_BAUPA|nr:uncharacterized protein BAUCODRAFT_34426 [Baudoinia panamericana UAMH 10762]EMC95657.1 hypothetical protein BAUCODRAFT_34426 [Baudoinia panamericana UAMH 10762]